MLEFFYLLLPGRDLHRLFQDYGYELPLVPRIFLCSYEPHIQPRRLECHLSNHQFCLEPSTNQLYLPPILLTVYGMLSELHLEQLKLFSYKVLLKILRQMDRHTEEQTY